MTAPSERGSARARAAVVLFVTTSLPALGGAALLLASRMPVTADMLFLVVDVAVALVYGAVAAVMISRRSHAVVWLIQLAALGGSLAALGGGWAAFATTHRLPGADLGMSVFGSAWVPGTLALFLVVPWLVREERLSPAAWTGLVVGSAIALALTLQRVLFPFSDNAGLLLAVVLMGLVTAAAVAWRSRHGPERERPGLGLLAAGTAVMALSFLPLVLVAYTSQVVLLLVPISHLACQALFPAALLVTMLRNRLWGIDIAVSRATLAGLLALGMAVVYAALVWAASMLVGSSAIAQVIAAVGVVLAVQPVRSALEWRVRRLIWGEAASPGRAALRVGASLSAVRDASRLLDHLAAAVGDSLRLESVSLTLHDGSGASGCWGDATSDPIERAVHGSGDGGIDGPVVATVAVSPRPGERLDRRTLDALDRLQPILAAGVGMVKAAGDLAGARDAATGARLAERRLIRRELHDGMGPWLSGMQLGLQGARNVLRADPDAADAVLAALQEEAARRVQDVRMLSRSLLPPILEERGLTAAIDELVAGHAARGFLVEAEGLLGEDPPLLRDLDPRVASAAYAVVSEAVLNAARHSGVARCRIDAALSADGAALEVACRDEGTGWRADATEGVGTASMRERVAELGGGFEIAEAADGGGTVVHARLPLAPAAVTG